jgi:D-serine deaminase-like pyridoxal phosphate-dependent protein
VEEDVSPRRIWAINDDCREDRIPGGGAVKGIMEKYMIEGAESVLTPALVIYADQVEANIKTTLGLIGNDPNRWRPHVKTAKLALVMDMFLKAGISQFKAATTLELMTLCKLCANDVLVAYPLTGAARKRVVELAQQYPATRISVLVDSLDGANSWKGLSVGLFVDINSGMNRTGVAEDGVHEIVAAVAAEGTFRGLHFYDGHIGGADPHQRRLQAEAGYMRLLAIIRELVARNIEIPEVVTSGTPTFDTAARFEPFQSLGCIHRVSPGTVVYCDGNSLHDGPAAAYAPAALVLSTVISRPVSGIVTCDAGHKSVSADAGVPTCVVVGHPEFEPQAPSEEHLPIRINGGTVPHIGDQLYLLPRHICPTVNNFDQAMIVRGGSHP